MSSVTQPYQIGVNALGDIVPIWRYSSDVCECGHTWAEHYQPRRGGQAACYGKVKNGLIDECRDFRLRLE